MPSYLERVAGGVAQYIAEHGLSSWDEFGEGTPYTSSTEWPTYIGPNMPPTPHRLIVVTPVSETTQRANVTSMIQIRLRGPVYVAGEYETTMLGVLDHLQDIRDLFHPNGFPLVGALLGDVRGNVYPLDTLPLDEDANRRAGGILNLRVRSRRPRPS